MEMFQIISFSKILPILFLIFVGIFSLIINKCSLIMSLPIKVLFQSAFDCLTYTYVNYLLFPFAIKSIKTFYLIILFTFVSVNKQLRVVGLKTFLELNVYMGLKPSGEMKPLKEILTDFQKTSRSVN